MRAIPLLAAIVLLLPGCAAPVPPPPLPRAEVVAVPVRLTHALDFPAASEAPTPAERSALDAFLRRSGVGPGDVVLVERSDTDLGVRRTARIVELLAARGLAAAPARFPESAPNRVRVVVERYVAVAPECPPFGTDTGAEWANRPLPGLGCATARNLAAMIARPRDLAVGIEPGPPDTEAATRSVRLYRLGVLGPLGPAGQAQEQQQ